MKPLRIALLLLLSVAAGNISAQTTDSLPTVAEAENAAFPKDGVRPRSRRHTDRFASRGYFGIAELNIGTYNGKAFHAYGADIINGYRTSPWFAVGVGVGARYQDWDALAVPFYIHLRTDILDRRVTPYFALNIGGAYMTCLHIFAEPSCGIGIRMKKGRQINIGFGGSGFISFGGALGWKISAGFAW